jgi:hypothetical protein
MLISPSRDDRKALSSLPGLEGDMQRVTQRLSAGLFSDSGYETAAAAMACAMAASSFSSLTGLTR